MSDVQKLIAEARGKANDPNDYPPAILLTELCDALEDASRAASRIWADGARTALLSEGYAVVDDAAVLLQNPYSVTGEVTPGTGGLEAETAGVGTVCRAGVVSRDGASDCARGYCLGGCSHLMWACPTCSSEGGWGAPRERLEELATGHRCSTGAYTTTGNEDDARRMLAKRDTWR